MTKTRLALIGIVAALAIRGIGGLIIGHDAPALDEKISTAEAGQDGPSSSAKTIGLTSVDESPVFFISKADYLDALRRRQARIQDKLDNKDVVEQIALRREISLVQLRIDDLQNSYQRYMQLVVDIREQLKLYRDYIDATSWQQVNDGFLHGNSKPAYDVLTGLSAAAVNQQLNLQLSEHARLKYLLGRISEDANFEERAYLFYKQAMSLDPYSVVYLLASGSSANRIALYNNAIQILETAREIQRKSNRQSELFADILSNLASAYEGKNQNRKASDYRRQALQIYMKVLGRQHAKTVVLQQLMTSKKSVSGE